MFLDKDATEIMRRNKKKVRYVFIDEEEKKENKSLRAEAIIEENKDAA